MPLPPISRRVQLAVRERLVDWYLGQIDDLFQAEGFVPAPVPQELMPQGQRRGRVEEYLHAIDWHDELQRRRFLRVLEQILDSWRGDSPDPLLQLLERDGFALDSVGRLGPVTDTVLFEIDTSALGNDEAIRQQLERMTRSRSDDAGHTIAAARALIEATCKLVLRELRAWPADLGENPTMPALYKAAVEALQLHPRQVDNDRWEAEVVAASKRTLGGMQSVVDGLSQLRKLVGHGQEHPTTLPTRWGDLAARSAVGLCSFMLDTLKERGPGGSTVPSQAGK